MAQRITRHTNPSSSRRKNCNPKGNGKKRRSRRSRSEDSTEYATSSSHSPPRNSRRRHPRRRKGKRSEQDQPQSGCFHGPLQDYNISEDEKARYVALDCEMVGVGPGGYDSALARVSIVNWDGIIMLDTFVRVPVPVTDYRTFVSGIRAEDLQSEFAMDVRECRSRVRSLIDDKILIGHALKNDLQALKITHPWYNTRDTAKYSPFMKQHYQMEGLVPRKLRDLAYEKLGQCIQMEGEEHCSIVDAMAALDLYKSVRNKWEKVIQWKMKKTNAMERQKQKHCAEEEEEECEYTEENVACKQITWAMAVQ
mmetsp:Transcript_14288/g.20916  ORF Transcript_14288/g.20916 Transcript_14288/m.20916 type:complete len:309 (+) Transcript_14288:135-1061(+)|eukprot:CAMPEP_0195525440 /NCGR_PEP_ID=MMETSP0794_2-20130614/25914_1 /TAXON_ID=515487 /ORGANISM="Stephanopyxis turris, Strain CCMP 815" /LENGTH=308 /DNA_ID=CAMNT_0040655909 /DNA_START=135 /DNA_END=1061 /DNA_ORIENTATION=-